MRYVGFSLIVFVIVIGLIVALQVGNEDTNILEESVNVIDTVKEVREQVRNHDAALEQLDE